MACVGDATEDHMFTDVSDAHAFRDAINCVAYYGITNGTGDGSTYSPSQDVTRAQMALFIARAAEKAGVKLGDAMDAGFSDIGGIWQEARDAINRLASKGMIPKGGAFEPDDAITRAEMAEFLIGLLGKAAPNVKIETIDEQRRIYLGLRNSAEADDYFADARALVPRETDAAISALYELGVTKGAGAATVVDDTQTPLDVNYDPHGSVNRGQMAAFITRALAHTSVRPEGLTAQWDGTDVVVSARDADFAPVVNAVVDAFYLPTPLADEALARDGTCGEVDRLGGTYACEIDGTDHITGGDGDARLQGLDVDENNTTVWVWTGEDKDKVNTTTELVELEVEPSDKRPATGAYVDPEHDFKVRFGSSISATVQLTDCEGDVSTGTDGKKPAKFLITLDTHAYIGDNNGDGHVADRDAGQSTATNMRVAADGFAVASSLRSPVPLTTDDAGTATFRMTALPAAAKRDPNGDVSRSDQYKVTYSVRQFPGSSSNAPGSISDYGQGHVIFSAEDSDDSKDAATVSVKPGGVPINRNTSYVDASTRDPSNWARVTVVDQYGAPIAGAKVVLEDDIDFVAIGVAGRTYTVDRNGSATFRYDYDPPPEGSGATAGSTQALKATYLAPNPAYGGPTDPVTTSTTVAGLADIAIRMDADNDPEYVADTGEGTVHWPILPQSGETDQDTLQTVLAGDVDRKEIVVRNADAEAATLRIVTYDSSDRFNVDGEAVSLSKFEKRLSEVLDGRGDATGTLTWSDYDDRGRPTVSYSLIVTGGCGP